MQEHHNECRMRGNSKLGLEMKAIGKYCQLKQTTYVPGTFLHVLGIIRELVTCAS